MADPETIKKAFQRNKKALEKRPSLGQGTGTTTIRVADGTTCEITNGSKTLVCDVGTEQGGNDAGPGPGILERGALGSCMAMGYSMWAAHLEIPIESIEVVIESDFDARGMFGVTDDPPGFKELRYTVNIVSPAPEDELRNLIKTADRHSPVLDDFSRPIPIKRKINFGSKGKTR